MSWETHLEKAGSFERLFATRADQDIESQVQAAMSMDSELFGTVGFRVVKIEKGRAQVSFPISKAISRRGDIVHGGIIMYSLDNVCGIAVMTVNPGVDQLTMELKVNFLEPLKKGPFTAEGNVVRAGRTVAVAEGEVRDIDGTVCAKSLGTWYMIRKKS